MKRITGPPCTKSFGCPKGTIDQPHVLHSITLQAYRFYRECRAVNSFPQDPWVRWFAVRFREVEDVLNG